jgi:hypothetical protein
MPKMRSFFKRGGSSSPVASAAAAEPASARSGGSATSAAALPSPKDAPTAAPGKAASFLRFRGSKSKSASSDDAEGVAALETWVPREQGSAPMAAAAGGGGDDDDDTANIVSDIRKRYGLEGHASGAAVPDAIVPAAAARPEAESSSGRLSGAASSPKPAASGSASARSGKGRVPTGPAAAAAVPPANDAATQPASPRGARPSGSGGGAAGGSGVTIAGLLSRVEEKNAEITRLEELLLALAPVPGMNAAVLEQLQRGKGPASGVDARCVATKTVLAGKAHRFA